MIKNRTRTIKLMAACASLSFTAAACGSDSNGAATTQAPAASEATPAPSDAPVATDAAVATDAPAATDAPVGTDAPAATDAPVGTDAPAGTDVEGVALPTGPLCSAVPADGEGSFAGMTDDTAATAASNNPVLSTLVAAVTEAGLVDTLNSDGPFTIFAPANPAFEALGEEAVASVLADKDLLTSILTLHVVAGEKLSSTDLAELDSVTTVNGADISLEVAADGSLMINGQASVGCADIQTANATVHVIDAVLMP